MAIAHAPKDICRMYVWAGNTFNFIVWGPNSAPHTSALANVKHFEAALRNKKFLSANEWHV